MVLTPPYCGPKALDTWGDGLEGEGGGLSGETTPTTPECPENSGLGTLLHLTPSSQERAGDPKGEATRHLPWCALLGPQVLQMVLLLPVPPTKG